MRHVCTQTENERNQTSLLQFGLHAFNNLRCVISNHMDLLLSWNKCEAKTRYS